MIITGEGGSGKTFLISAIKILLEINVSLQAPLAWQDTTLRDAPYTLPYSYQFVIIIMQT